MSYTPTEWEPTDVVTATRMNALETAVGDINMSYTPNTWSDGDILSAEKMNALEQAVASGGGGGSDFSTATVTLNPTAPSGYEITWWSLFDISIPPYAGNNNEYYRMAEMTSETSNQFTILLYRGVGYFEVFNFYDEIHDVGLWIENPTLSENITWNSEIERYIVTGDCTISGLASISE